MRSGKILFVSQDQRACEQFEVSMTKPFVESGVGHRSSRLNLQYRVIYKIEREEIYVQVEKVTPHDYGRN